jgi:TonB-dependent starch-binding outer membrane protein SusC
MDNHFYGWFSRSVRQGAALKSLVKTTLMAVIMLVSVSVYAQDKTITGKVSDKSDGSGMPGVSVAVKGLNKGTQTDVNGAYKISAPANATLVFSFVGFAKQEIATGNRTELNVTLVSEDKTLDEVVVVGYGTTTRKDATGGVTSLSAKEFNQGVIASPEQLLQGRAAGVQITPSSGEPGAGINIRIRGVTSLRGGGPLYVVDGVALDGGSTSEGANGSSGFGQIADKNPLNFMNPNDIENITVLKDASAAAIYGSRGANGVVLITTKKGKSGSSNMSFNASTSIASNYKNYDVFSTADFVKEAAKAGLDPNSKIINAGSNTNWQDQIFRTAVTQNYNLSYGGGNDNTNYFFSLGYNDQQGTIKNSYMNRVTARINATHKLFDNKVVLSVAMTTSQIKDKGAATGGNVGYLGSVVSRAIQTNPTYPIFNSDGTYYTNGSLAFRNPVSLLEQIDIKANTNRTLMNVSALWNITKDLSFKTNVGLDNSTGVTRQGVQPNTPGFADTYNNEGNAAIINKYITTSTIEHTLNYKTILGKSKIDALAGFAYQKFETQGNGVFAGFFTSPQGFELTNNIGFVDNSGSRKAYSAYSYKSVNDLQSYFGRVNYSFDDKYLLTGTLRVDGSSRFGLNNKYGYFPSVAAAWRLVNEDFVPKEVFSDLKMRVNYGITGSQELANNASVATYVPNSGSGGINKENVPNPDLKWEQTTAYGIGLDFGLMKGKLTGTVDYFNRSTDSQLFQFAAPQPDVATSRWANIPADIRNSGVEVTLNYQAIQSKSFSWDVNLNSTFLNNEVKSLDVQTIQSGFLFGQGLSGAFVQPITQGYPLFGFFLKDFKGYDSKGNTILSDGPATYKGSPLATFAWGVTNNFTFGAWNASVFINGQSGGYTYNNTANAVLNRGSLKQGNNVTAYTISSTPGQDYGDAPAPSTLYLEKSDFIRVSNMTIGHTVKLPGNSFAKSLNISLTGQNLLLITSYTGLDPEITNPLSGRNGVQSVGIDYIAYPKARIFTLGVSANF